MSAEYRFENDLYAFYRDGVKQHESAEVALLFDRALPSVQMHGDPKEVCALRDSLVEAYRDIKFHEEAENLVVVQGAFPLEELNLIVNYTSVMAHLFRSLEDQVKKPGLRPC